MILESISSDISRPTVMLIPLTEKPKLFASSFGTSILEIASLCFELKTSSTKAPVDTDAGNKSLLSGRTEVALSSRIFRS